MDTGRGTFRPMTNKEVLDLEEGELKRVFQIGETVRVKGSLFRVKAIKPTELRLKLLPRTAVKEGKDG